MVHEEDNDEECFSPLKGKHSQTARISFINKLSFLCPTPETHDRFLSTRESGTTATSLTDIFGWSVPVERQLLKDILPASLDTNSFFETVPDTNPQKALLKATFRVSSFNANGSLYLHPRGHKNTSYNLYVHSSYPCRGFGKSGVFCGPDTYRFLSNLSSPSIKSLIVRSVEEVKSRTGGKAAAIDLGCGPGAGALGLSKMYGDVFSSIVGLDINPFAISFADINGTVFQKMTPKGSSHMAPTFTRSSFFSEVDHIKDLALVISDPPYIPSATATGVYRDGGDDGMSFAVEVIDRSLARLVSGGPLIMHTGVCIPASNPRKDRLLEKCIEIEQSGAADLVEYVIIDNDVFGEEVAIDPRKSLGRISAVGIVLRKT